MKRRVLSMLLCLAMALSLLPMSALAAEPKTTAAWAQAYRDYIQEDVQKFRADVNSSYFGYSLVNIDEDAIPELYINYGGVYIQDGDVYIQGGGPAEFGQQLCTFTNGKVYGKKFSGYSELSYLPGKNCILESGVRMGTYWDDVYSLSSGELIQIASGNHYFVNFTEPQYSWNNREVDEATYDKNLNDIFPTSQAEHHYDWKSYQEMLDFLDQQVETPNDTGDTYLQIYATDEDMRIGEGEKISILCKLYQSGKPVQNWEQPVFIIDRDDVLSMSDETPKSGGYSFDVTGKKEGTAVLTVSDADTGASASISIEVGSADPYSYTIASVPSYFPNEIFDDKIQTNFYNVNGLYVNGYTYSKKSGSYQVSFNAYNRTHMYGSVDVYDKDGRWIQSKRIDRYKEISSLSDTGGALWDLVVDAINGRYFVYTAKTYTAETNVQISVPEGGYFVISNNMAESPGTFLYNSVRFMALGTKQVLKLASNEFDIQKLSDDLVGKAIKNPSFLDVFHDSFHDIAKDTTLNLLEDGLISSYGNVAGSITRTTEEILDSVEISWKHAFTTALGIADSTALNSVVFGPAGQAMKLVFAGNGAMDAAYQIGAVCQSINAPYVTIHAPGTTDSTTVNGVSVNLEKGQLDTDTVLNVYRVVNTENVSLGQATQDIKKGELYNIAFTKNTQPVQPNGTVTVRIPIPDYFVTDACTVFRQEKNGTWTPLKARLEGKYITFETDHFSLYSVVNKDKGMTTYSKLPFSDVRIADWFYNDVKYVYEKGMMSGTAADVFAPNATTTRAMIVTILYRLEGSPAVTGTSSFVDVPAGQWYTDAVNWAAANQIVKGTSATTFAPNDSITREQMAAILYRYAQYKGYDVTKKADLSGYSDNGQVSAYAKDALAWANAAKLINGVTNTTLAPQGNATRAQVSAILHRFCDGVVK